MAALLLSGGTKGERYALPHSKIMIHEPLSLGGGGSATTITKQAEDILDIKKTLNMVLAQQTGKTLKAVNKATDHDNLMTAEEAKAFGLIDEIAGLSTIITKPGDGVS